MSHNTWVHRAVRPLARRLAATAVTPNQITWVRLAGGFAAAAAFAMGDAAWLDLGAGIFLLSFFLDRLDGELARVSGKKSAFGHKLDLVSDALANALAFVGLGLGMTAGDYGAWAPAMGLLAGVAVATVMFLVMRLEAAGGERAGELRSFAGFDPDDAILAVPILVWAGQAQLLLLLASIGAPLFAVLFSAVFAARQVRSRRDV